MSISIFDLFTIGIGPSSSHTVGPMRAAKAFVDRLAQQRLLHSLAQLRVELYGSLALTGEGHGTGPAIINGLMGETPEGIDPEKMIPHQTQVFTKNTLSVLHQKEIPFLKERDFVWQKDKFLSKHSNGMVFTALDEKQNILLTDIYYSVGGGFIVTDAEYGENLKSVHTIPYHFHTAHELLTLCEQAKLSISQLMLINEHAIRSPNEVRERVLKIANAMISCIDNGCHSEEKTLPGGLGVRRRAPTLWHQLQSQGGVASGITSPSEKEDILSYLTVYAIAVNEENAAGKRVVTAPTNGAAGVLPAVLKYYLHFHAPVNDDKIIDFLLTAAAVATLYKRGASISAAEVGCQGEVGVACSMAAAALTAVLGGTLMQIENAAEIGMEHHLGLTCDPINGLVQIPCIERNAMGAVHAVTSTRLALMGDGIHKVSLDKVIATMLQTGKDMRSIYKETSLGGLAANLPEC